MEVFAQQQLHRTRVVLRKSGPTWLPSLAAKHHLGIAKLTTTTRLSNKCCKHPSNAHSVCMASSSVRMAWMR